MCCFSAFIVSALKLMCKVTDIVNLVNTYGTERDVVQTRYLYFFSLVLAKLGKNVS